MGITKYWVTILHIASEFSWRVSENTPLDELFCRSCTSRVDVQTTRFKKIRISSQVICNDLVSNFAYALPITPNNHCDMTLLKTQRRFWINMPCDLIDIVRSLCATQRERWIWADTDLTIYFTAQPADADATRYPMTGQLPSFWPVKVRQHFSIRNEQSDICPSNVFIY